MKRMTVFIFGLALGVVVGGCGKKEPTAAQPTNASAGSGNPLTAPVDYLGAVNQGRKTSAAKLDMASLKQAIEQFQAAEERFPKTLEELVNQRYLSRMPEPPAGMKFDYNPQIGAVKVVPE